MLGSHRTGLGGSCRWPSQSPSLAQRARFGRPQHRCQSALVERELAKAAPAGRGWARDGALQNWVIVRKPREWGSWKPVDSNSNPFRTCREAGRKGVGSPMVIEWWGWPCWRWAHQGHGRDSEIRPAAVGRRRTNTWAYRHERLNRQKERLRPRRLQGSLVRQQWGQGGKTTKSPREACPCGHHCPAFPSSAEADLGPDSALGHAAGAAAGPAAGGALHQLQLPTRPLLVVHENPGSPVGSGQGMHPWVGLESPSHCCAHSDVGALGLWNPMGPGWRWLLPSLGTVLSAYSPSGAPGWRKIPRRFPAPPRATSAGSGRKRDSCQRQRIARNTSEDGTLAATGGSQPPSMCRKRNRMKAKVPARANGMPTTSGSQSPSTCSKRNRMKAKVPAQSNGMPTTKGLTPGTPTLSPNTPAKSTKLQKKNQKLSKVNGAPSSPTKP
ncbi:hypothetical protein P7K49_039907, partial [Saguinus oedipus]